MNTAALIILWLLLSNVKTPNDNVLDTMQIFKSEAKCKKKMDEVNNESQDLWIKFHPPGTVIMSTDLPITYRCIDVKFDQSE